MNDRSGTTVPSVLYTFLTATNTLISLPLSARLIPERPERAQIIVREARGRAVVHGMVDSCVVEEHIARLRDASEAARVEEEDCGRVEHVREAGLESREGVVVW